MNARVQQIALAAGLLALVVHGGAAAQQPYNGGFRLPSPVTAPASSQPGAASPFTQMAPMGQLANNAGSVGTMMPSYYGGYYPGWYDPYYSYLSGAADVITAQGQFMVYNQQAMLMKEQVRQAKIDNRRRVIDEWLYERANLPTLQDDRERAMREANRRATNDPPITEIWTGQSLNVLLTNLQKAQAKNVEVPPMPLDEEILKHINVVPLGKTENFGLLKDGGNLQWPLALRELVPVEETTLLRKQMEGLFKEAMAQARGGPVQAGILTSLQDGNNKLGVMLKNQVHQIPPNQYIEAKRYLSDLDDAIKLLRQPDAGRYVSGHYSAKGRTVQELVKFMTDNGLGFAPAVPGDEAAYVALQRAMAAVNMNSQSLLATESPPR
jgi:hypothetical protein